MNTSRPVVVIDIAQRLHHGVLGIARSLGRLGVAVHVATSDAAASAVRSRYVKGVHRWQVGADPEQAAADLVAIGRSLDAPLVCPVSDLATLFVEQHADRLAEVFTFPRQPAGLVAALHSKQGMHDLCIAHGVATPRAAFPQTQDEARAALDGMELPVVLKPIDSHQSVQGVARTVIAGRVDDVLATIASYGGRGLIQEYIPGGAESVWMFNGYFDASNRALLALTGRKVRQYPVTGGVTSLGLCTQNETVLATTTRFMAELGYTGVLDCGYRYDARDGEYKMLDVNPRIGSSFRLFVDRADLDVARAWYFDLTGQEVVAGEPPGGRRWIVEDFDLVSAIGASSRVRGSWSWARSMIAADERAWLARDDLRPARSLAAVRLRRAMRRGERGAR